ERLGRYQKYIMLQARINAMMPERKNKRLNIW
ncbi:MAG: hypothetical protein ACI85G_001359, partial [Psychroserpens sp.]